MPDKLRIAMLISGGGTTMQAIIRACKNGALKDKVEPVLVIASRAEAGGLQKACDEGIPNHNVLLIARTDYPDPLDFGEAILMACQKRRVDFIGQYGWMVKTPANVIEAYQNMMVNQHPGPLDPGKPDFGGKGMFGHRVHCARLYFVRKVKRDFTTEAVAQRIALEYDQGAVLRKRVIPIQKDDDPISLQERVLPEEHLVQIETLEDFADGNVIEITRRTPLVFSGEEKVLAEAKKIAKMLFPKG